MRTDKLVITVGARAGRQAGAHGTDGPNTQQHTYHTPLPAYGVGPQAPLTTHMYLIGQEFLTCGRYVAGHPSTRVEHFIS